MFGTNDRGSSICATFAALFVTTIPFTGLAMSDSENKVHFAWVRGAGAESCPAEATLAKIVSARLGRDPFFRESPRFIEGVVERTPSGWSAFIRMSTDGSSLGTRELTSDGPDCSAITAASVLAIAIGIDPDAALGIAPNTPPAAPPPAPLESAKQEKPPEKLRFSAPSPSNVLVRPPSASLPLPFPRITVSPRGILGFALLPRIAPGFALMTGLEGRRWEAALGMLWLPEVSTSNDDFAFGITAITLGGCMNAVRARRFSVSACLGVHGGAIHPVVASGQTYVPLDVRHRAWFAGAFFLRARIPIASLLSIDAGVELVIPLIRRDFAIREERDPVFAMAPLGFTTFFGPTLSIP
jgi:hypothetical protein